MSAEAHRAKAEGSPLRVFPADNSFEYFNGFFRHLSQTIVLPNAVERLVGQLFPQVGILPEIQDGPSQRLRIVRFNQNAASCSFNDFGKCPPPRLYYGNAGSHCFEYGAGHSFGAAGKNESVGGLEDGGDVSSGAEEVGVGGNLESVREGLKTLSFRAVAYAEYLAVAGIDDPAGGLS